MEELNLVASPAFNKCFQTWIGHRDTYVPSLLNLPPTPSFSSQSTRFELPVYYSKFPLPICFTYGNVYVSMLVSLFRCRPVFKVFNWIFYNIGSVLYFGFFFGPKAYGILDSWPGTETMPSPLEGKVLTTGLPEKSLFSLFKTGS